MFVSGFLRAFESFILNITLRFILLISQSFLNQLFFSIWITIFELVINLRILPKLSVTIIFRSLFPFLSFIFAITRYFIVKFQALFYVNNILSNLFIFKQ